MKIAIITTQSLAGSTNIGRILPIAHELSQISQIHLLVHKSDRQKSFPSINIHDTGRDPFTRTPHGKKRLRGLALIMRMKLNALRAAITLVRLKPNVIVISKSLPESVLAAWLAKIFLRRSKVILDVDDFELTANQLTSLAQRATIHWAERTGGKLANTIVAATPFLSDHFAQLTQNKQKVIMIPTGITAPSEGAGGRRPGEVLLYIGSISISSGHRVDLLPDILEQVLRTNPQVQLTIAGSGDDSEKLKREFNKRGLSGSVSWHGRFKSSEVDKLLQKAAVIIDPVDDSIINRAKSSFRTMVAAACGIPIVTSDIGIRPYLLPQHLHRRFFASPAKASDYAQKISNLLQQPLDDSSRQAMIQHAQQYTWQKLAERYRKTILS